MAAEISSLLALSAIRNNDKVGLVVFTDHVEKFIPARKGLQHVLRVIREVLYFEPKGRTTNIAGALEYLGRLKTRRTICFLISDFFTSEKDVLRRALSITNKKHDLIAITLNAPKEYEMPVCGMLTLDDSETGEFVTVDTTDPLVRGSYSEKNQERLQSRKQMFQSVGMDHMDIYTNHSYMDEVVKFFLRRQKRR